MCIRDRYLSPSAALAVTAQVPIAMAAARVIANAFLFIMIYPPNIMFKLSQVRIAFII